MSSQFKTKEFKTLKNSWYSKLKKSGFNDIEQDENLLKVWDNKHFLVRYGDSFKAKEEYFRIAGQFLYEYEFENKLEKHIWTKHIEGLSVHDIAKFLYKK